MEEQRCKKIKHMSIIFKNRSQVVAAHAFNPSTWEVEAGRALWVQMQPGLQSEFQDSQSHPEKPCLKKQKPQIQRNTHQNPSKSLQRPQKNGTQLHMEEQKTQDSQKQSCTIKELLEASQSLTSNFISDMEDQWNPIEDPDIYPYSYKQLE